MNKFEEQRTKRINIDSKTFKHSIPVVFVEPKINNDRTKVFIFCCGLGGTNSFNVYMNNSFYDEHYFITYDKMGHGENKNLSSQYKNKYLIELNEIVNWAKQQFESKEIYLLGESWGSSINFLYCKKFPNKVSGVINWNMPTKAISPVKKTVWQNWQFAWREFFTMITNINLLLPLEQSNHNLLSRNKMLVRAISMQPSVRNGTKLTLAVWRFMKPSLKFLLKKPDKYLNNFLYVQSGQDALMCNKHIRLIESNLGNTHFVKIPTGYHILTMEPEESKTLYKIISDFIDKN